ncbi:unnamed protein product [Amoebophrya sp. A25]|nr:unnamed protein product [Amoebophrya sp. A25]|eukprot:GSA25T00022698001.1
MSWMKLLVHHLMEKYGTAAEAMKHLTSRLISRHVPRLPITVAEQILNYESWLSRALGEFWEKRVWKLAKNAAAEAEGKDAAVAAQIERDAKEQLKKELETKIGVHVYNGCLNCPEERIFFEAETLEESGRQVNEQQRRCPDVDVVSADPGEVVDIGQHAFGAAVVPAGSKKLPVVLKEGRTTYLESIHNRYDHHSRWHQGLNEETRHATIMRACFEISESRRVRLSRGAHKKRAFEELPLGSPGTLRLHGKYALPQLTSFARQRWRDWNFAILFSMQVLAQGGASPREIANIMTLNEREVLRWARERQRMEEIVEATGSTHRGWLTLQQEQEVIDHLKKSTWVQLNWDACRASTLDYKPHANPGAGAAVAGGNKRVPEALSLDADQENAKRRRIVQEVQERRAETARQKQADVDAKQTAAYEAYVKDFVERNTKIK